jgi:hypothetical protein
LTTGERLPLVIAPAIASTRNHHRESRNSWISRAVSSG